MCTLLFVLVAVLAVSAVEGLQYANPSIEKVVTVEVDLGKTSTFSGEIETHASGKPTHAVNHLNFIFVLKGSPGITYKGTIKVRVVWDALLEIWEPYKDSHGGGHVKVQGGFDLEDQKTWDRRVSGKGSHQKKPMKGTKNLEFEFEVLGWSNEYRFGVIAVAGGEGLKGGKYDARTKIRVSGTVESEAITGLAVPFNVSSATITAPPDWYYCGCQQAANWQGEDRRPRFRHCLGSSCKCNT